MRQAELPAVTILMKRVGQEILAWRADPQLKQLHSKADFKTEADRRAHVLISEGLTALYPGVPVISEEGASHDAVRPSEYWLIDPIDGTASWYHGFDGFVTQAAYVRQGVPLFGIVHAPVLGKTWTAVRDGGAYLNDVKLARLGESTRLVVVDNTKTPHGIAHDIMLRLSAKEYSESGSLGLKAVLVADGTVDLFVKDVPVRDWDLAPAAAILHEVGGLLQLADGSPYVFDGAYEKAGGFIVARDPVLMRRALSAFAQCKQGVRQ